MKKAVLQVKSGCRTLLLTVAISSLSMLCAPKALARIVYNASEALIAASVGAANPYTDANGATWSVLSRPWANSGATDSVLMEGAAVCSDKTKGIGSYTGWFFVAGTRANSVESALGNVALRAGEIVFHPLADRRAVLRFTVPRSGRYSLSAQFRTINPGANGRTVDATVLFNGATLSSEGIDHSTQSCTGQLTQFEKLYLKAGDVLDFAVGPGFNDVTKNGCDSTALSLSISEEEEFAFDPADRFDTVAALTAMTTQSTNPFTDEQNVVWGMYETTWKSWKTLTGAPQREDSYSAVTALATQAADLWYGSQAIKQSADWCRVAVNLTGTPQPTRKDSSRKDTMWCALGPNEIAVHPDTDVSPRLRFTTPKAGCYMVTAVVRDLDDTNAGSTTGIDAGLVVARIPMATVYAHASVDIACNGHIMQVQTTRLAAGETIELIVSSDGSNANDSTGVYFDVVRLPDIAWTGIDLGEALAAQFGQNANPNPFTDAYGTWTCGYVLAEQGVFSQLKPAAICDSYENGQYAGWTAYANSWSRLYANVVDVMVEPSGSMVNMTMHPHELFFHPDANGAGSVLRFSPKSEKAYDLHLYARDVDTNTKNEGEPVVLAVTVNGTSVRSYKDDLWTKPYNKGVKPWGFNYTCTCWEENRVIKGLYLGPNDALEIRVQSNKSNGYCGTGVRAWLMPSDESYEEFLNVDIEDAETAVAYGGTAAAGFTGMRWTKAKPGEEKNLRMVGGVSTVKFRLVRDGSREAVTDRQEDMNALMDCGVISAGTEDVYQFSFDSLVPGKNYRLWFYGDANARFVVGEESVQVSEMCFAPGGREFCALNAVADADGRIVGTFASSRDDAHARFCGMQIGGCSDSFTRLQRGLSIILR